MRLGEWDVSKQVEVYPQEDYTISGLRIHEKYQNDTLINDIAVITLSEPVPNNVHISPICLPSESETFNHGSCVVTGWGNRDPIPKESYVECLNDAECQDRLRRTKLGPYYNLDEGFLCGSSRLGNCLVDGGGPLVCKRKDETYALIGLISWSVDVNSPEVYVRVQNYLEWINSDAPRNENEPESQPSSSSTSSPPPPTTRSPVTTTASGTHPTYPKEESYSSTPSQPQEWILNRKKESDESEYSYASASGSDSAYAYASASSGRNISWNNILYLWLSVHYLDVCNKKCFTAKISSSISVWILLSLLNHHLGVWSWSVYYRKEGKKERTGWRNGNGDTSGTNGNEQITWCTWVARE